jgi:hypothetical protein
MTPAEAAEILAKSSGQSQRSLSRDRVNSLAWAITNGQFRATHQPVALSPKGYLIDGQHRLTAIVAADKPVDIMVAYDVDPDTFDLIDTGRARTPASTLQIAGIPDSNVVAAGLRLMFIHDTIKGTKMTMGGGNRGRWSSHEIREMAEGLRGTRLRKHATAARVIAKNLGRQGSRTWVAVALTLIEESGADATLRAEFEDKLASGAMLPETSPILALRKWISGETGYARIGRSNSSLVAIGAMLRTWNDWLQGRERTTVLFRFGIDLMPIPQQRFIPPDDELDLVPVDETAEAVPV